MIAILVKVDFSPFGSVLVATTKDRIAPPLPGSYVVVMTCPPASVMVKTSPAVAPGRVIVSPNRSVVTMSEPPLGAADIIGPPVGKGDVVVKVVPRESVVG